MVSAVWRMRIANDGGDFKKGKFMAAKKLDKSATSRLIKLGGLAGRVGLSMAGNTLSSLFRSKDQAEAHYGETLMKNALTVKDAFGQMKGVPMKIGQMLSLHENLMPREVARVFQSLQKNAPAAPFEDILQMVKAELGEKFDLIVSIDEAAMAAASIGQVHRAVLKDGREIALKIQYPGIDQVIRGDLRNFKGIIKTVFSLFTRMDIEEMWQEMRDRLMEELDYLKEAENMRRMKDHYKNDDSVIVPEVIPELTSRHVLAMEMVMGVFPDDATGEAYSQELKNRWGMAIARLVLTGLFKHRFLHADPNLSNFAFREDGAIVVYDYGCMKAVTEVLSRKYALLVKAVMEDDYPAMPQILKSMGVYKADGEPVTWEMIRDYADEIQKIIDPENTYTFGIDSNIYKRLQVLGQKHLDQFMVMVFPKDIIFIDRTFNGHFGNLNRLRAEADWRALVIGHIREAYPDIAIDAMDMDG